MDLKCLDRPEQFRSENAVNIAVVITKPLQERLCGLYRRALGSIPQDRLGCCLDTLRKCRHRQNSQSRRQRRNILTTEY